MNDLIPVIVPIYNTEKYLTKCIKSILAQTYPNLELILVNDRSTDNSGKICEELSLGAFYQDPDVLVFDEVKNAIDGIIQGTVLNAKRYTAEMKL